MKIAILSDIHGNVPALNVVLEHIDAWQPDHVIVNGDTINRGPDPHTAWQIISERITSHGWMHTMGNHEEYVLAWRTRSPHDMPDEEFERYKTSYWTYKQFSSAELDQIATHPKTVTLTAPDGTQLLAAHASPANTRDGMLPWTHSDDIRKKVSLNTAVFITSHTHRFFQRTLDGTLIVNSGSVGVPLDGHKFTGYGQITWEEGEWAADLIRLPYNRAQTRHLFHTLGFLTEGGASARLLFKEWEDSKPHIPFLSRQYDKQIKSGAMTLEEAVEGYIQALSHN